MYTISNIQFQDNIHIAIDHQYIFTIKQFWFFESEQFLFTLKQTFKSYNPVIQQNGNIFKIYISFDFSLGKIVKNFYKSIYNHWLYY